MVSEKVYKKQYNANIKKMATFLNFSFILSQVKLLKR